jgi:PAS domain S-box-containing protein
LPPVALSTKAAPMTNARVSALCAVLSTALFVADVSLPLGVNRAVLYVAPILISLRSTYSRLPVIVAGTSTALTVLGAMFGPAAVVPQEIVVSNRIVAVAVIWITAILGVANRRWAHLAEQRQQHLKIISDNLPVYLAHVGPDLRYRYVNKRFEELFGQPAEFFVGRHIEDVAGHEAYEIAREHIDRVRSGRPTSFEALFPVAGVGESWFSVNLVPMPNQNVSSAGFLVISSDISARVRAEKRFQREREFKERLVETAQAVILVLDQDGRIVYFNRFMEDLSGYLLDDVRGQDWFDTFLPPRDRDRIRAIFQSALRAVRTRGAVNAIVTKGNRERYIEWYDAELTDDAGGFAGLLCVGHDITERRRAEEALRANERRLRALVDSAADAIVTIDHAGTIQSFNPAAEHMFGYAAADVIGRPVSLLMPSPHRERHNDYLNRYLQTGVAKIIGIGRQLTARRKDGTTFPVDLAVSEIPELGLFTGIIRDISDRHALERQVLETAEAEKRRIAYYLHDETGQKLAALGLLTDTLIRDLDRLDHPTRELAEKVARGLQDALADVRALCRAMIPVEIDSDDLPRVLGELANRINASHRVHCAFQCNRPVSVRNKETATQLFRIAQEAVSNSLRHSGADRIIVSLRDDDGVTLEIADNGIGTPTRLGQQPGLGLSIMRYRAELIGGRLDIQPADNGGTVVSCVVNGDQA